MAMVEYLTFVMFAKFTFLLEIRYIQRSFMRMSIEEMEEEI